jgi:anti-anti-sigma factor
MTSRARRPATGLRRLLRRGRPAAGAAPAPEADPGRPLSVEARVEPGCTMLKVMGEIDISTSQELDAAIAAHAGRPGVLAVDLSSVTFMDSTGLRALVALERERTGRGLPLAVICPPGPARLICEVAGVEAQLRLYASAAEAAAALGGPHEG